MPKPLLDEVLKRSYVRFDRPADEIVRQPQLREEFCGLVRTSRPELATTSDDEITRRLIQLRKLGQNRGGLPRIRH